MSRATDDEHPVLTTVGIAAVAVGVLMVVQPGLAASVGVDYAAVLLVGMIALVQAVRTARTRQASEIHGADTPDVETVETMPTPGDEFDRTVATLQSGPRRVLIRNRADLRETLEEAAVTAVADRENCSREAAREHVEEGTWTDDVHAAAFLGGSAAPSPPLFDRLKLAAATRSAFQFRLRRTADAVARTAGVTPDASDENGQDGDEQAGREGGGNEDAGNEDAGDERLRSDGGESEDAGDEQLRSDGGESEDAETGREREVRA